MKLTNRNRGLTDLINSKMPANVGARDTNNPGLGPFKSHVWEPSSMKEDTKSELDIFNNMTRSRSDNMDYIRRANQTKVTKSKNRVLVWCGMCESRLVFQRLKESDHTEDIFFKIYKCPTCDQLYKGLSEDKLTNVKDPSIKAIVESYNYD